jgi:hypothetical protein
VAADVLAVLLLNARCLRSSLLITSSYIVHAWGWEHTARCPYRRTLAFDKSGS